MRSSLVTDYILPIKIVDKSDSVQNADTLLNNRAEQVFLTESQFLFCRGKGFITLDFGKELCGGVRLLTFRLGSHKQKPRARLRFGESVGETKAEIGEKNAVNDHSVRDFTVYLPDLSDQEWGNTGFRFVRIDFLDDEVEYKIINVYAAFRHRDLLYRGDLRSEDALVDKIFDTARYTLFLTMQNSLIEGVKRDRLVWIGDMQPQVRAITDIFGENEIVEKAIGESVQRNPLPSWFGNIPTYSFWFIQILYDYYLKVGNKEFVLNFLPYIEGVLKQLDACVSDSGDIDYSKTKAFAIDGYFLDWRTRYLPEAEAGNAYLFIVTLRTCKSLFAELGVKTPVICDILIDKLRRKKYIEANAKQVVAFGYLAGEISKEEAALKLTAGGADGLCTFLSYYILCAVKETVGINCALDMMKDYYGGMLDRGATTFWEDFDLKWLDGSGRIDEPTPEGLKDLHGDYGAYCYLGFRHSLCHGWSCGPIQFLMEEVAGIKVIGSGCKKIQISPDLGYLKDLKVTFPTPYGDLKVAYCVKDGKLSADISAPDEIEIVR